MNNSINEAVRIDYVNGFSLSQIRDKYGLTVKQTHRIIWKRKYKTIVQGQRQSKKIRCAMCAKEFVKTNEQHLYCSEKCRIKNERKQTRSTRKARERGAEVIDKDIKLEALAIRDEQTCYLCGQGVDWQDKHTENGVIICGNYYPSVDHVIPLVKGGVHSWDNIKLSHRICNSVKSDK